MPDNSLDPKADTFTIGILVSRVPPTCMVLANFFVGDGTDGPVPIHMGSDSLQYNDLTRNQYNGLKDVFENWKNRP